MQNQNKPQSFTLQIFDMNKIYNSKKATILSFNSLGYPIIKHVKLKSIDVNNNSVKVCYQQRTKRSKVIKTFNNVIIADKWQHVFGAVDTSAKGDWNFDKGKSLLDFKSQLTNIICEKL